MGSEPAQIRQEIQRTRSAMDHTVDELADRLSPGRLLDEVWNRVRAGGIEGVGNAVREHPIPIALMGLGLGWLAIEQATGRSVSRSDDEHDGPGYRRGGPYSGPGTWERAEGRRGPYRGDAISGEIEYGDDTSEDESTRWKAAGAAPSAKEKAGELASRTKDRVSDAASSVKGTISDAAHAAMESADDAVDAVRHGRERAMSSASAMREGTSRHATSASSSARRGARSAGRKAKRTFSRLMEENPLAVGAVAFGLGLASGVSAPSTSLDDRVMGRASDDLEEKAKDLGRETARKAKDVAREAARAASDEAKAQREEGDLDATAAEGVRRAKQVAAEIAKETEAAARDVGSAAKEAAKERAKGDRAGGVRAEEAGAERDPDRTTRPESRRSSSSGPSPSAGSASSPGSPPKP